MGDLFDLDAVANEDERPPFTFTFGGDQYEMPADPNVLAVAALSAGRLDDALRMLLGPAQYDRMQASTAVLNGAKLDALFKAYMDHAKVDPGESSASSPSSSSTGKR